MRDVDVKGYLQNISLIFTFVNHYCHKTKIREYLSLGPYYVTRMITMSSDCLIGQEGDKDPLDRDSCV